MPRRYHRRRPWRRWLYAMIGVGLLCTILPILLLRWVEPPSSSFMLQRQITAWQHGLASFHLRYTWVDWHTISPYAALAVIASEDQKFPQHWGFDFTAITTAVQDHWNGGRLRGASTISQQVAKNLFLWPSPSFVRKGIEAYFTIFIELFWPKRRVLEMYLNLAEFGTDVFGVAAASEAFFRKAPEHLTAHEAALLAAVLPNPRHWHVMRPSAHVLKRRDWILQQMNHLGGTAYVQAL